MVSKASSLPSAYLALCVFIIPLSSVVKYHYLEDNIFDGIEFQGHEFRVGWHQQQPPPNAMWSPSALPKLSKAKPFLSLFHKKQCDRDCSSSWRKSSSVCSVAQRSSGGAKDILAFFLYKRKAFFEFNIGQVRLEAGIYW